MNKNQIFLRKKDQQQSGHSKLKFNQQPQIYIPTLRLKLRIQGSYIHLNTPNTYVKWFLPLSSLMILLCKFNIFVQFNNYLDHFNELDQYLLNPTTLYYQLLKSNRVLMKKIIVNKSERKFTKPNSISPCLRCPICMEPFYLPTRLFCGHTYCYECINNCIKNKPNCPVCRTIIVPSNVGRDLLAYNIINELEVFCIYEECSWRGQLEMLELHLNHECFLHSSSETKRHKLNDDTTLKGTLDEEVEQKINDNINKGCLISRAIKNDDSLKAGGRFDVAIKMLKSESNTVQDIQNGKKKNNKKPATKQETKQNQKTANNQQKDNFDYLMELYD